MGNHVQLMVGLAGVLAALAVTGCTSVVRLSDGTLVKDRLYVRDHEWCEKGIPPGMGAAADMPGTPCAHFAHALKRGSAPWYEYMIKACDRGADGACSELVVVALGRQQWARLIDVSVEGAFRMDMPEPPRAGGALAKQIYELAVQRCKEGPRAFMQRSLASENIGDTCLGAIGLMPPADSAVGLVQLRSQQMALGRRGCHLGSNYSCGWLSKRGEKIDWAAHEARKEAAEAADERVAQDFARSRAEQSAWEAQQRAQDAESQRQSFEQLRQSVQQSQEAYRRQMEQVDQIARAGRGPVAAPPAPPPTAPGRGTAPPAPSSDGDRRALEERRERERREADKRLADEASQRNEEARRRMEEDRRKVDEDLKKVAEENRKIAERARGGGSGGPPAGGSAGGGSQASPARRKVSVRGAQTGHSDDPGRACDDARRRFEAYHAGTCHAQVKGSAVNGSVREVSTCQARRETSGGYKYSGTITYVLDCWVTD